MVPYATESELLWLNVTNVLLGVVVLACMIMIGAAVFAEVRARRRKRVVAAEPHALFTPELGLTMADGGEPVAPPVKSRQKKSGGPKR